MKPVITTRAAALLLIRVRLLRSVRTLTNGLRKKKAKAGERVATGPKASVGSFYTALFAIGIFAFGFHYATNFRDNVERLFVKGTWSSSADTTYAALMAVTALFTLLFVMSLLMALMSKELANPEWDLEWLATLPLPTGALLWLRMVERAFSNTAAMMTFLPFFIVLGLHMNLGLGAVPLAVALLLPLFALLGIVESVLEIAFRRSLRPAAIRNLQAVFSVLGPLAMIAAMLMSMGSHDDALVTVAKVAPGWLRWTPTGLVAEILVGGRNRGPAAIVLVAQAVVAALVARLWLARILRDGLVLGGARESKRRATSSTSAERSWIRGAGWLSPLHRREFRLLLRDRAFMVRTMVTPAMMTGFQLILSRGGTGLLSSPKNAAATGFGAAAYSLLFSAYQSLASEGRALWVLYGLPRSLERIVVDKALFWTKLAAAFPIAIFIIAAMRADFVASGDDVFPYLLAFLGLPLFAMLATALGVMAANPLDEEPTKRTRISHAYLYMMLAGAYIFAIVSDAHWPRFVVIVLLCSIVFALWQKARDHLPYLLDPTATPASTVSLADGLLGALMFFLVQISVAYLAADEGAPPETSDLFIAFGVAGLATFAVMRLSFGLQKVRGQPRFFGKQWQRSLVFGVLAGGAAGGVAAVYTLLVGRFGFAPPPLVKLQGEQGWIAALAVLLAPVFEEWIFRGLVFAGMKRSMQTIWAALASSIIFAIVHPPVSAPAVFVLALAACWVYHRTHLLLGAVMAHATYNGIVLALALSS